MRKFIINVLIFFCCSLLVFICAGELIIESSPKAANLILNQSWLRIKQRLHRAKRNISGDTLYVGCSVAGQLLPFNNNNQLTTNGSTYPIGNYFLIKKALANNPNIKTVIYLSVPSVIGHEISRQRTYNYFVKPFYNFDNLTEINNDSLVYSVLDKNPLLPLCLFNSFKILSRDDFDYSTKIENKKKTLSQSSINWVSKIDSLCLINNVKFHLASPPVPASLKSNTNDWNEIRYQIKGTHLEKLFNKYLQTIIYVDDKYLKDEIHWQDSFISKKRHEYLNLIKEVLNNE